MEKKIKFKYKFDDNYNPKYINGAYGGITPKGEIAVNFYFERASLPKSQTHLIDDKGKLSKEIECDPVDLPISMIRFVDTGIILDLNSAKIIVDWLTEKIDTLEKVRSSNPTKQK